MPKSAPTSTAPRVLRRAESGSRQAAREARRYERSPLTLDVRFVSKDGFADGVVRDMSLGGVFVETATPAAFGETITVEMPLPGIVDRVAVRCFVRWTKPTGMGLQFDAMGARETHAVALLLAR